MKPAKACQQCRLSKRRCHEIEGRDSCVPCLRRQLQCTKSLQKIRIPRLEPVRPNSLDNQEPDLASVLSQDTIAELVDFYMQFIHDKPHSLFHSASLRDSIQDKSISKALLYSICAMGSRFSVDPNILRLQPRLIAEAKRLLQLDVENVCLENVQTCILVANLCASNLDSSSEALYFGIANRMVDIMGLIRVDPTDTPIIRESKIRVWWTLFMADRWCSTGLGLPRRVNDSERTIDLPMDEHVFQEMSARQSTFRGPRKSGLWAHMSTLVEIFGPVQDLIRRLVQEHIDEVDLDRHVDDIAGRLDIWEENLPLDVKLSTKNLDEHQKRGLGSTFVALHLGYHHYSTLLFFQYLDTRRLSTPKSNIYADRCKNHAFQYSALLQLAREREGCEALHMTVGHMTMVASAVLLHTLLFGDESAVAAAREHLNSNFVMLIKLKKYWPGLEKTIGRLFMFQNACLLSEDLCTHKMDKWMVRFLVEHALPLDEKSSSLAKQPASVEARALSTKAQRLSERGRLADTILSEIRG